MPVRVHDVEFLANSYVRATEIEMATLEDLQLKKNTPKSAIRRHTKIVDEMVDVCHWLLSLQPSIDLRGSFRRNPRVCERLGLTELLK